MQVFEDSHYLMLVMEFIPGVELFDAILAKSKYPEDEAKPIFRQIAAALAYLHEQRIVRHSTDTF